MTLLHSRFGLVVLAAVAVVLIGFTSTGWKGVRIDLTQDGLYTLSQGSRNIIDNLESPVALEFYFSQQHTEDNPHLRNYGQRIRDVLREFAQVGGDKIDLRIIDPEPFSQEEDEADLIGMQSVRLSNAGDEFFLGLSGRREGGEAETIAFFHPNREEFLEQDISKLIYLAGRGGKPTVGILSSLDVNGGIDFSTRQPTPAWVAVDQLRRLYNVQEINALDDRISEEVDLLILIQPGNVSDAMLYAIDQYVVRGGNTLVFADPHSDMAALTRGPTPVPPIDNSIIRLLTHWGVQIDRSNMIADARHAVSVSRGDNQSPVRHLAIQAYEKSNIVGDDVVTNKLESLIFSTTSAITQASDSTIDFVPLIQSSAESMLFASETFDPAADPDDIYAAFEPTGERHTVAARVSGSFNTVFPGGYTPPVPEDDGENAEEASSEADDAQPAPEPIEHIENAQAAANLIVVADSDFLSDRLWVRVQNFFGQQIAQPFADNGDFVLNAVDNLLGSADLIGIRGRGQYARPFDVVEQMQREADAKFQKTERELTAKLDGLEAKLDELQAAKGADEDALTLNEEQLAEIENFQAEKLQTRKALRDVRHQLGSDIDNLGSWLKFINTALVPILLTLVVLFLRWRRRSNQALA
ncbi:MAG: Gldg family protein [Pseudomonadota bacterium]